MKSLKGKKVLITGGAGGIGLQTAVAFAREGSTLILTDIDEDALRKAAKEVGRAGAPVHVYRNDVTDAKAVEQLAKRVAADVGEVDVLVNNAGIGHSAELKDMSLKDWDRLLSINVLGPIHFVQAFLPSMIARKDGTIVNIASGQVYAPVPTWGAYAATKTCLATYSEILHYELARYGIHVLTVFPYVVNSPFYTDIKADSLGSRMMLKFIPYYAVSPEKTGRIIVSAVKKGKKDEMHHVFVKLLYTFSHLAPQVVDGTGHVLAWALARKKGSTKAADSPQEARPEPSRPRVSRAARSSGKRAGARK